MGLGLLIVAVPWLFLLVVHTIAVVEWTAHLPLASLEVETLGRSLAVLYHALLFGGLGLRQLWQRPEAETPLTSRRAVALAAVAVILFWLGPRC